MSQARLGPCPPVTEQWEPPTNRGGRPRGSKQAEGADGDDTDWAQPAGGGDDHGPVEDAQEEERRLVADLSSDSEAEEDPDATSKRAKLRAKFNRAREGLFFQYILSTASIHDVCGPTPGTFGASDYQALVMGPASGSNCPECRTKCLYDDSEVRWQRVLILTLEGSQVVHVPVFKCSFCHDKRFNVHPFDAACFPATVDHGIELANVKKEDETPIWFAISTLKTINRFQLDAAPDLADEAICKIIQAAARDNGIKTDRSTLQHYISTVLEEFMVMETRARDPNSIGVDYPVKATDITSACSACAGPDRALEQVYLDGNVKLKHLSFAASASGPGEHEAGLRERVVTVEVSPS
jgi:hypothetical protein